MIRTVFIWYRYDRSREWGDCECCNPSLCLRQCERRLSERFIAFITATGIILFFLCAISSLISVFLPFIAVLLARAQWNALPLWLRVLSLAYAAVTVPCIILFFSHLVPFETIHFLLFPSLHGRGAPRDVRAVTQRTYEEFFGNSLSAVRNAIVLSFFGKVLGNIVVGYLPSQFDLEESAQGWEEMSKFEGWDGSEEVELMCRIEDVSI